MTSFEAPAPPGYDRQVKQFMDSLSKRMCEFAVDAEAGRIFFKGGFSLDGASFRLVDALRIASKQSRLRS